MSTVSEDYFEEYDFDDDASAAEERRYDTLAGALRDAHAPRVNKEFILRVFEDIDVDKIYRQRGYIKVTRKNGGPALQIYYGYTNGFCADDAPVVDLAPAGRWQSARISGTWGITHPEHKMRDGNGPSGSEKRLGALCPNHAGTVFLPLSGICEDCEG